MKYCKKCLTTDLRPNASFSDCGVCLACQYSQSEKSKPGHVKLEMLKSKIRLIKAQQKRRGFGVSVEGKDCLSDELRDEIDKGVVTAVVRNDGTLDELQEALGKTLSDTAALKR